MDFLYGDSTFGVTVGGDWSVYEALLFARNLAAEARANQSIRFTLDGVTISVCADSNLVLLWVCCQEIIEVGGRVVAYPEIGKGLEARVAVLAIRRGWNEADQQAAMQVLEKLKAAV